MFVIFHLFHFLPNLPISSKSSAEEMEEMSFFHFLPPVRKKVVSSGKNSTLDLSDKKKFIKYGNIPLGEHFNLRYSKLKSDY